MVILVFRGFFAVDPLVRLAERTDVGPDAPHNAMHDTLLVVTDMETNRDGQSKRRAQQSPTPAQPGAPFRWEKLPTDFS